MPPGVVASRVSHLTGAATTATTQTGNKIMATMKCRSYHAGIPQRRKKSEGLVETLIQIDGTERVGISGVNFALGDKIRSNLPPLVIFSKQQPTRVRRLVSKGDRRVSVERPRQFRSRLVSARIYCQQRPFVDSRWPRECRAHLCVVL